MSHAQCAMVLSPQDLAGAAALLCGPSQIGGLGAARRQNYRLSALNDAIPPVER